MVMNAQGKDNYSRVLQEAPRETVYPQMPHQRTNNIRRGVLIDSIFMLSKEVLDRITQVYRNFLWSGIAEFKRVPHLSWDTSCQPKKFRGLSIKDFLAWNKAKIAKQLVEIQATTRLHMVLEEGVLSEGNLQKGTSNTEQYLASMAMGYNERI
ncbi:hypothetical protein Cgig2_007800 [Carnegiea gigantea]|uniref:Uncharacterized protein n=1 Tax=Carnegiea gigantea TaxID=171969 RepID=A0A9Q1GPI9_9CARY|nr:hypothetical protein Cgig2_007800 [Carnegiea gigantea]